VTDADLIARTIVSGDHAAFGVLVRRHQSAVRYFLRHLAHGDTALADDLAQETFIQAYRNLANFRGEAGFLTWLLGIAYNQYRNSRRHAARRQDITAPMPEFEVPGEESALSPAQTSDLQHDLAAVLRQLSPDQQAVIHLCYQQGLTHPEAAAVLDCPLGTVKTHLARAKDQLRNLLAAWNPQT